MAASASHISTAASSARLPPVVMSAALSVEGTVGAHASVVLGRRAEWAAEAPIVSELDVASVFVRPERPPSGGHG
jgi:hypothetical protein